jgi:arylsulfatase A-like enzyme
MVSSPSSGVVLQRRHWMREHRRVLEAIDPDALETVERGRAGMDRRRGSKRLEESTGPLRIERRAAPRLLLLAASALFALFGCGPPEDARPPNVVFIVADDQGFGDYGFMGSEIVRTPRIDRLAAEGAVFTHGWTTASACQPSLITLLTGLEPTQWYQRLLQARVERPLLDPLWGLELVDTLPRLLAERGYASFQAGKFFEGTYHTAGFTAGMTADLERRPRVRAGGLGTDIGRTTMRPVLDFIHENRERPFFLFFAPMLPHKPHNPPKRLERIYRQMGLSIAVARYYAMCTWLDEATGQLLDQLETSGVREDTLVVFLADNGWETVDPQTNQEQLLGGRRGKLSLYDAGFRTPVIVSWPGRIDAGMRSDALVSATDLVPTVLDYVGLPIPSALPGSSLRPLLEGTTSSLRDMLIVRQEGYRSDMLIDAGEAESNVPVNTTAYVARDDEWSYFSIQAEDVERLYHISSDPGEQHDLAAQHPEHVARFERAARAYGASLLEPYRERALSRAENSPKESRVLVSCMDDDLTERQCLARIWKLRRKVAQP